jgi:NADH-quinone oxidoreductase subunit D
MARTDMAASPQSRCAKMRDMTATESTEVITLGLHPGDAVRCDRILDLGARHPSAHGMFRLRLTLDGSTIVAAEPLVGSMHRGAEKLFEARDYRQLLMLTDRHDWLSSPGSELGAALAMEHLLGLTPPLRGTWLRTLLAELNRIGVHALFLAEFPWAAVEPEVAGHWDEPAQILRDVRERILTLTERLTGARIHVMWNQVGGVRSDIPDDDWRADLVAVLHEARRGSEEAHSIIEGTTSLKVAQLTATDVDQFGVTGVMARACGVRRDLRVDIPYLAYGDLVSHMSLPYRTSGDAQARLELLCEEIVQSALLLEICLERLADIDGPIDSPLPKVLRLPEGSAYRATENPLGANGYWLVSAADRMPQRMKLRSASFNNVSALPRMLEGQHIATVLPALATTFFVTGDIDK